MANDETHKLTIRVDSTEMEQLDEVCTALGVSYAALLQALIRLAHRIQKTAPASLTRRQRTNFARFVDDAREIDTQRRNRRK